MQSSRKMHIYFLYFVLLYSNDSLQNESRKTVMKMQVAFKFKILMMAINLEYMLFIQMQVPIFLFS